MGNNQNKIWRCSECETVNSGEKCVVCGGNQINPDETPNENIIDWDKIERKAGHGATNWNRYDFEKIKSKGEANFIDTFLWLELSILAIVLIYIFLNSFDVKIIMQLITCFLLGFLCRIDVKRNTEKKFIAFSFWAIFFVVGFLCELGFPTIFTWWQMVGLYIGAICRMKFKKNYRNGKDE